MSMSETTRMGDAPAPMPQQPAAITATPNLVEPRPDGGDRSAVFGDLVTGDTDIVGLVAYSIYKQNKHDWLVAFNHARGREPDENETATYIIGESTPRRLAIYRHLAQATLDGRGPAVPTGTVRTSSPSRNLAVIGRPSAAAGGQSVNIPLVTAILAALVVIVGAVLAFRYGAARP